ncbi:MAG TPA: bifunctional hydroxymethylpyrimidine kinase/phosphomethylpyrimidine kinase [Rectinemataceae bacterium]|nr:bifunctional hydroxymethylpyrimidine kinase/phosphomethylpyrimidine kinase [Rectinemataceae bacterium]
MKRALTIAGSDSGGGAGIQADLKTFAAHGVFGMSAITALTAQNSLGVQGVFEIPPEFVAAQIESVISDFGADAVKIGMISNSRIIEAVAGKIRERGLFPLVVDPVMVAKGGDPLLHEEARESLIGLLLPLATVVTPNLPEAEALCGFRVANEEDMRRAAREILRMGPKAVVVKGGHLESDTSDDLFFDGRDFAVFSARRIESANTHGTGCTFASAIAARLALGIQLREAVAGAKTYVNRLIAASLDLGLGKGHGPMNHLALARLGWELGSKD